MDFTTLLAEVGLWPAAVIILAWWVDRIRREQIAYRDKRITSLEAEAHKAIEAKNQELAEWKRIAWENKARPSR